MNHLQTRQPLSISRTALFQRQHFRKRTRIWYGLSYLWSGYLFAIFSFGRYPEYTQPTIWVGGVLVTLPTLIAYLKHPCPLPKESYILLLFSVWSMTGLLVAKDWPAFWFHMRMNAQMLVVITSISIVIRLSGMFNLFYVAFLFSVCFNILIGMKATPTDFFSQAMESSREAALTGNPNALGFYSAIGLLGTMAIIGEKKSRISRIVSVFGACLCLFGIIASGSRGAFLVLCITIVLWPIMCFRSIFRKRISLVIFLVTLSATTYFIYDYILSNTYLGKRLIGTIDPSSKQDETTKHLETRLEAFQIFTENPLIGIGQGQLSTVSSTKLYAHNEILELLASTGIVGLSIYLSVYWTLWKRLKRIRLYLNDLSLVYICNFTKLAFLVVALSGALFRPIISSIDTIFLLGVLVGTSEWLRVQVELPFREPGLLG